MKIGDIIKLVIIDTNENGVGIAKADGAVIFVPGTVTEDTVNVQIVSAEKNYYIGKCLDILDMSRHRISPSCDAGNCGGCTLGHISYEFENEIKKNTVMSAFRRAGLDYTLVEDTVYCHDRTGYRNKITVHYSKDKKCFGLYAESTNDVIPFTSCKICPNIINEIIVFTNSCIDLIIDSLPTSLCVRTSSCDELSVSLYSERKADINKFVFALANAFPAVNGVNHIVNGKGGGFISDRILDVDMRFSSEAFRQVNTPAFEKLLKIVHRFAEEFDFNCGADLYCGSGIIGLTLAKRFPDKKFYGIEINSDAVKDAKYNAEVNGIGNIKFFCGDSATFKQKITAGKMPEFIVVDPPRAGLSKEMRRGLVELAPDRIIYVSCNPQTLSRDISALKQSGYEIKHAIPVNMFPMTAHCECVASLEKTK